MTSAVTDSQNPLLPFLKTRAPFSAIERGMELANSGLVCECSRSGSRIQGIVNTQEGEQYSCALQIITERDVEASCSCSSQEDMNEQWCQHALALCWRSHELGFFEPQGGFAQQESTFRLNSSSPEEIAETLVKLAEPDVSIFADADYQPEVTVYLRPQGDRLAVKLFFDNELQSPTPFDGVRRPSVRALDNVLLDQLEQEGSWDEIQNVWLISASRTIEHIIGLAREYKNVYALDQAGTLSKQPIIFASESLDAKITLDWQPSSVELSFEWIRPHAATTIQKSEELIGTGPYWVMLQNTWYRVSPKAVLLASMFPYTSKFTLSRAQVGPILEALNSTLHDSKRLVVLHPELQPKAEVHQPVPVLILDRINNSKEHFSSKEIIELTANLNFEYPVAPEGENVVYIPDREREKELREQLSQMGFVVNTAKKNYFIRGEATLDFLSDGNKQLASPWRIEGLDAARKGIRFAELNLNVTLSTAQEKKGRKTTDWFDCQVTLTQNNAHIPISALFKQARMDEERWIKLESGAYAKIPGGNLSHLKTTFGILDSNFRLSNQIKTKLSSAQALSMSLLSDPQFKIQLDKKMQQLTSRLQNFSQIEKVDISKAFKGDLRPYQADGLNWMSFLRSMELGGILADEMGLGKTVQTIALLQHLKDEEKSDGLEHKPTLVVAPTSVITNWSYELERFAPKLKAVLLHGSARKKLFADASEADIIITSYALLRMDRPELERLDFRYIILDEAQNIKNPDAATTRAAKALKAEHRLALTGTPTENRPLELWSIIDFLMPGYLGTYDYFKNYIERPILEIGTEAPAARFLQKKTKPFILRRKKNEVEKDLPAKTESVVYVQMSDSQRQVYSKILEEVRPKVFDAVKEKGIGGASISILAALLRLRQVCNHPYSIEALKPVPNLESGKFNQMKELVLEALESGRKILLFSQFREMLSLIKGWLEENKISHLYLDGATRDRQSLIDRFNGDDSVRLFLISLKAGGTGLNLTAADTVIIYDPWWNPAVESQAIDRAHRIGQTKPVTVYRLVTEDSVERKIMELKAKKEKIVNAIIDSDDALSVGKLSKTDLESLFSPLPKD